MINDEVGILTYWPSRQESSAECAPRLLSMVRQLAALNRAYKRWVKLVDAEDSPLVPAWRMPPMLDDLQATIQKRQMMRDVPYEPWPELGYTISAWNGEFDPTQVALHGRVGIYDTDRAFANRMWLTLSPPVPGNEELSGFRTVSQALLVTARSWDVAWGVVKRTGYTPPSDRVKGCISWPLGGWMTYLSAPLAAGVTPPPTVMAERLPGGAMLLMATEESFDPQNPAHVVVADAIDGALAPIRQSF